MGTMGFRCVFTFGLLQLFSGCCSQTIENVALHKPCKVSSSYNRNFRDADKAVDNIIGDEKSCIHTATNDSKPFWEVDLGRVYPILNIVVYIRPNFTYRMDQCTITIDDEHCYTFNVYHENWNRDPEASYLKIKCKTDNVTGRIVRVSKEKKSGNDIAPFLEICEFQVFSCSDRYWGSQCDKECGQCKGGTVCDKVNGSCNTCESWWTSLCNKECLDHTYGTNCELNCIASCSDLCQMNDHCECWPGERLQKCIKECTKNNFRKTCKEFCQQNCRKCLLTACWCLKGRNSSHRCYQGCEDGYWGSQCVNECGHCEGGTDCDKVNGTCKTCDAGQKAPSCTEAYTASSLSSVSSTSETFSIDYATPPFAAVTRMASPSPALSTRGDDKSVSPVPSTSERKESPSPVAPLVGVLLALLVVLVIGAIILLRRRIIIAKSRDSPLVMAMSGTEHTGNIYDSNLTDVASSRHTDTEGNKPVMAVKPSLIFTSKLPPSQIIFASDISVLNHPEAQSASNMPAFSFRPEGSSKPTGFYGNEAAPDVDFMVNSETSEGIWDRTQMHLLTNLRTAKFSDEFEALAYGLRKAHDVGLAEENLNKNRFTSVLPYDENRVVLNGPYDSDSNDYINASYIPGHNSGKDYIAAQGPKVTTINDFWKMVWQDHVTHIVMLTNLMEKDKTKCEEYWPPSGSKQDCGEIQVTGTGEQERANFVIRTFDLSVRGSEECHHVKQYHYKSWPDHAIPSPMNLVDFWRTVRSSHRNQNPPSPLLVHCSAGVGRTGTYIALDIAFDQSKQTTTVDMSAIVTHIREFRCNMVQTKLQYRFLFDALFEAYTSRYTRLSLTAFDRFFPHDVNPYDTSEKIDAEFEILQKTKSLFLKDNCSEARKEENINKNRNHDLLPDDRHLVYLTRFVPGRNQYINAVFMSTFQKRMGRIITQLPMPHTVVDFWRLVDGQNVAVIISLDPEKAIKKANFWPQGNTECETLTVKPYSILLNSKNDVGQSITFYKMFYKHEADTSLRQVSLLHYSGWTDELPGNASQVLHLVDTMISLQAENPLCPVIVQCLDGVTKSGLFSVVCDIISRMTYDRDVDVYMAVRHLHGVKHKSIASLVQYRYLYLLVQEYKRQRDVYINM